MNDQVCVKPAFDDFVASCTPLLRIPELEQSMRERVHSIVADLLHFESTADPSENLKRFLQKDPDFLGVLLALTNLSQEKFLRILTAQRFAVQDYGREWGPEEIHRRLLRDDAFAEKIARLFLEGRNSELLAEQVADFYLDQLSLPGNWSTIIRDENMIGNIVRKKLVGEYTDQKGEYVERRIRAVLERLRERYGVTYAHGQVTSLGKEVDHVIPSLDDPYVMVMVSYMETTSSHQTGRANEQQKMYERIVGDNVRRVPVERVFVNVVDGAGWLARRSDLRKMHAGCHFCLNMRTIDQLEAIICRYVPQRFFRKPG
jgi:hypothetical protein